ncbi:hypothetical protein C2G38_2045933 [Gigaspora rosea]|uniref:Uncharacterized protein n=1 Tax=Gigaspora rosea TaxID=44941 RepID=A0A397UBH4_9GLOM|nr:hypothetical protein C2G38_2045933 [Gigaspora rosea]
MGILNNFGRKKNQVTIASSSQIIDELLNNANNPQDKENKQSNKKQKTAATSFSQIVDELLNNDDNLHSNNYFMVNIPTTSPLQKEEIVAFVDESATINTLNWWLNATNEDELHQSHLRTFIQSAFAINYTTRGIERTRALDRLTKNITVLSRNGKNFASNMQL